MTRAEKYLLFFLMGFSSLFDESAVDFIRDPSLVPIHKNLLFFQIYNKKIGNYTVPRDRKSTVL